MLIRGGPRNVPRHYILDISIENVMSWKRKVLLVSMVQAFRNPSVTSDMSDDSLKMSDEELKGSLT